MIVHRNLDDLPDFKNAVITTGTFDGVHKGHLKVIEQVKKEAKELNGESVIVTFFPHPRMILNREQSTGLKLLTSFDEKLELLARAEVDHVVVVPFTKEFSRIEPENYISDFLVARLKAKCIITGYDHHFGKDRRGDFQMLERFSKEFQYFVREIPEYILKEIAISSTRIRNALTSGDILTANECLGYSFFLTGKVIRGDQIGRTLGFPTANINVTDQNKLVPRYGIYIAGVSVKNSGDNFGRVLPAIMSVGTRPTLDDNKETQEAYILDFDGDLYGSTIRILFMQFIRPELRFKNLDILKEKMKEDEKITRAYWKKIQQPSC